MKPSNKIISYSQIWILAFATLIVFPTICFAQGKIAFSTERHLSLNNNIEIYIMDPDGSNQMRLTNNTAKDEQPVFSPDGSKIAFVTDRDGNDEIYVMNADGTDQTRVTNNSVPDSSPAFNSDGTKIVFDSVRDGDREIYIIGLNGLGETPLTTNTAIDDGNPSFCHATNKIVFNSGRDADNPAGSQADIYIMDSNGSNVVRLTSAPMDDAFPACSPDGSKVAFMSRRAHPYQIYVMDSGGGGQTQLTSTGVNANPSFSPDSSKIAFSSFQVGLGNNILVMDANGSNQALVTSSGLDDEPAWGVEANAAPTISATGQTVAADSSGPYTIGSVSDAEDAENNLTVTVDGGASSTKNLVTVSGIGVNASGALTATIAATCSASSASFTLRVTDSGGKTAEATLNVTVTAEDQDPTLVLPSNIVEFLAPNSTDISKVVTFAVSADDNCDGSPTVVATPASGSVFSVGTTTVNVTATDDAGNTATGSFTVTVRYNFAGFFQPVDNLPTLNMATAGQSIPIKFSLSGNKGSNIFAAGSPASQTIPCVGGISTDPIEETATAGSSALTYDALTDRYQYVWKTQKSWRGTCRQLLVTLNDGSTHVAWFQFR